MPIRAWSVLDYEYGYKGRSPHPVRLLGWGGGRRLLLFLFSLLLLSAAPPATRATASTASTASSAPIPSSPSSTHLQPHLLSAATPATATATPSCGQGWNLYICPGAGPYGSAVGAVTAIAPNDVWAVGAHLYDTIGHYQHLIEHWDGNQWSVVPLPDIGVASLLVAVAAVTSQDVWAFGWVYPASGPNQTLTEHWDGTAWSIVPSPNVPGTSNRLYGAAVVDSASNDIWAFGQWEQGNWKTLTMHWDGNQWSIVPSPKIGNESIVLGGAAVAANDVWAVGEYWPGGPNQTLTMHWDGNQWSIVPSPNPNGNGWFYGATAIASNNVWAVGNWGTSGNTSRPQTLTEHWDGSAWQVVPSPNVPDWGNELLGVAAIAGASDDIWAVGYSADPYSPYTAPLSLHWDGSQWSMVEMPAVEGGGELLGVAGAGSEDVWAAGVAYTSPRQPIAMHWDGSPCATPTATSSPTPSPTLPLPTGTGTGTPVASLTLTVSRTATVTATGTTQPTATATTNRTVVATPTACPIQFTDVPVGSTFYTWIRCLACRGIVNGYADGTFRPNNNVTRGQMSKIVSNSAGFSDPQTVQMFQDVPPGSTFFDYIGRLASRGYISGYPCGGPGEPCVPTGNLPYFRTNNNATRGQITKIVSNAAGFVDPPAGQTFEDIPPGSTFYTYTERLVSRSIMQGYPCGGAGEPCVPPDNRPYFRPNNNATRGQTSKIVSNTFFPGCQTPFR
jgi:hypothetical protein